jgi:hypothetical protein
MVYKKTAFFAYPSGPNDVAQSIRMSIAAFNAASEGFHLDGWEKNDISGLPLVDPIFSKISEGIFLAADITYLNENVAFEIGYAIGSRKRSLLFVNRTHVGDRELANSVGIFDTLGFEQYDNSTELNSLLIKRTNFDPIDFEVSVNHQQPVYIIEPPRKNDAHLMLVSRTKKGASFRQFSCRTFLRNDSGICTLYPRSLASWSKRKVKVSGCRWDISEGWTKVSAGMVRLSCRL